MAYLSEHIFITDISYEQAEDLIRLGEARWCPIWTPLVWACWREVGWADPRDRIPPPGIEVYQVGISSTRAQELGVSTGRPRFLFICRDLQWAVLASTAGL